jgi:putative ABC transport system substrate-binding protein
VNRRDFLFSVMASLAGWTSVGSAQQSPRIPILGLLMTSAGPNDPVFEDLRKGLHDAGYVDGQNIKLEFRVAQGHADRLRHLAEELVQLNVDAILVATEPALLAAKQSTSKIPIVATIFDYDPVAAGMIDSLGHPGGNVTGIFTRAPELVAKRLELLKEAVPGLSRVAVLWDSYGSRQLGDVESAARAIGIRLQSIQLKGSDDFETAFTTAKQLKAGAVMLLYSPLFFAKRDRLAQRALENGLPVIGYVSELVRAGLFMSYGSDARSTFYRVAYIIDRLLKGVKPTDLPVEQPTKFELVVNLKTAKTLGITIPESILLRADEVIR